jgi:serine/threonine protein kinase
MEDELWSILFSCCNALHSLYLNKISHECLDTMQILIEKDGIIKLADPILVGVAINYLSLMNENPPARIPYISPELVSLVEDNNFYYYDKEKSDVFILAMITLEAANLTPIPYYEPKTRKISLDLITQAL